MTDREKLIELLLEVSAICSEDECETCHEDCYIRRAADHMIANGVTFATDNNVGSKWIPVTERLPDLELVEAQANGSDLYPCLCTVKSPRARGRRYVTKLFYDGENFMDRDMCLRTLETTHWRPLPELPKGE